MKYNIVSWNCGGGFRKKFRKLLSEYPDTDIFVVAECENPWFYDDEDFKHLFANGFRVGIKTKGLAVWAREGIVLKRLDWPDCSEYSFAPVLIDNRLTLVACWTHGRYVEELHDYLDDNLERISGDRPVLLIGDINSNTIFDREHGDRHHTALVARLAEVGLADCYHRKTGEAQGAESMATYYHRRKQAEPFHIDHAFANPSIVASFGIAAPDTHASWLEYSDHMPLRIVVDTDPKPQADEDSEQEETTELPPNQYYDEQGRLHIIRKGITPAQAQSEWEAKQKEQNKQRMYITVQGGPTFTGSYGVALVEFIKYLGWEVVRDMNFEANHGPLVAEGKKGKWWLEVAPGWQVNCNLNANSMRITAYSIAKAFGKTISVHWS